MPKLTDHPSREELSAYSLGQLPEERAVAIDSHISECEPCCETIVELSSEDTFAGLLQEAGRLPTDQPADHDGATANSASFDDIPQPLTEHPRYEILGLIGKGGMGDVYKARHRKMERTVALKVINRGLVQKAEAIDRFHREVKAAAQLSHPNIVTSHDADHAGDFHFMVMEFVDGVDLSQTVKKRGALPVAEACDYIRQAAIGLQHAHERGMVHRDIKPHNLMVTADGTIKILDFGLASLAPEALPASDAVAARADLTAAGAIMGTPDFISPEQARDARKVDIRSDIYSLGATLYYLLSGRVPFDDGSVMHKLKGHAQVEPAPLDSVRDEVPEELVAIASKMMAKDPNERYLTPSEVADALQSFLRTWQPGEENSPRQGASNGGNNSDSGRQRHTADDSNPSRLPMVAKFLLYTSLLPIGLIVVNEFVPLGLFSGETDWFWCCVLTSIALSTISGIVLGVHQGMSNIRDGQRKNGMTTGQTALIILILAVSAFGILNHMSDGNWHIEVTPQSDRFTLGTHPLTIVNTSGEKPFGGTHRTHKDRAAGITTHSFESANGRYKITLVDKVLTVNGEKYTLENPSDAIRIVDDRVEITRVVDLPKDGGAEQEIEQLQGEWDVIAFTKDGKREFAADQGVGVLVQIKGDTITRIQTAPNGEKSEKEWGRIEINSRTNPKSIDFVNPDRPGGRLLGIYELKEGTLKLCFVEQRNVDDAQRSPVKRPTTFDAPVGSEMALLECRRAIEGPDVKQLQGDWEAASVTEGGKTLAAEDGFGGLLLQIKGNTFVIAERKPDGEKSEVDTGRIEINSTKTPKTIDFIGRAQPTVGIYELKDGALRICLVEQGGTESLRGERIPDAKALKRPTTFESPAGSNIMLMEFTRSESAQEHDVSTIQGTWQVTYSEDSGRIAPQEMLRELRFVIDEQTLTTEIGGRKSVSTYRLDPSTNPKSIDLTENGRTKQAIYDLLGDTLRICIAESGEQRPTAFDSQPNSANDIVLILKRVKPDNASADGTQDQKHDGPLSEEQARSLIPTAASISNEDFQKLQTNPSATSIKNKSLSLALMTLDIGDQSPEAANDFRFLVEGYPKPSEIAAAMSPSRSKGYFSIIQPDYITECKITNSTDEIAQGKVTFNAPKLYIGSATFEARKQDGTWRIEKFHLPSRQISIVLGEDGNWHREGKEAEGNQAPDASDSAPDATPVSSMSNAADVESLPLAQVLNHAEGLNDDQSLAPSNSQLDNVDFPRLAISPDITSLVWVDVRKVTTEKIQQSLASLLDAAPPEKREWANEVIVQCRRRARPGFTALEKGMEAGIEVLVMGEKTNPASAVAADVEDALDFVQNALTAIELGLDAEDFDTEVPEPVDSKTGQLFVRMRPDTNPEDAIAIMVETFMTEARVTPGSEEAQALEQVKAMEFVEIGDSWFAVMGEKMLQPKDQALDTTPFVEALEKHKGAAIRFAWLMDDETRAEFDRAQLESGALSFGGLLTSLQEMQSTSGGIWLGQRPEIALDMEFANQEDAQLFKATFDKLVSSVGRIAAIGTDDPEEKLQAEQIRAGLSLLFLDRDEARLSKTFDIALLQRLTVAGLPWTRLFEPDSADESEKSDVVSEPPVGSIETPADEKRSPGVENDR